MKTILIVALILYTIACGHGFNPCPISCYRGFKCVNRRCIRDWPEPDRWNPRPPPYLECSNDHQCRGNKQCINGRCVITNVFDGCQPRCYPPARCVNGQCLRPCSNYQPCWPNQECQNGICIRVTYPTQCRPQCMYGATCVAGRCVPLVDPCLNIRCYNGYCKNGQCYPNFDPCTRCAASQKCVNGVCVDKCHLIICGHDSYCSNGICVRNQRSCRIDKQCDQNDACRFGVCTSACAAVSCFAGSTCIHGNCVRTCQWPGQCFYGQVCEHNICVRGNNNHDNNIQCDDYKFCGYGATCKNGRCVGFGQPYGQTPS